MNKVEKLICLVLGAVLAWYVFTEMGNAKKAAESQAEAAKAARAAPGAATPAATRPAAPPAALSNATAAASAPRVTHRKPEETVVLSNAQMSVELTTWGGAVKSVTLFDYAERPGPVSADNPSVKFDFASSPALEITGGANLGKGMEYEIAAASADSVTFKGPVTRTVTLKPDFRLEVRDAFDESQKWGGYAVSLGVMRKGGSKNDILSLDTMGPGPKGDQVRHWCEHEPLKGYLVGGLAGGCSGRKSAAGLPVECTVPVAGRATWLAAKNRFFVAALAKSTLPIDGFDAVIVRDARVADYALDSVTAIARFSAADGATNEMTFYFGPKKQSLLWDLGMKDVMEFGMWRWLCYPLVWVLNLFHSLIPSFGVAIILLTILVRLVFWPLTHKSTVGMRRMQELQPKMKEIQAKFKDNPQRLQQETWALYREAKVNPLSSCLPMLIQIPVFIALFNVLRSAVELRYAPFLWISDLSEPEALFASWFPFGGLNILPLLMAGTMALQSALTPSTGDRNQQKMMIVIMPVMMLFMFYSFPSALSLYWTLSQVISIVQMWMIRRQTANR